jgi:hypothetical protein
MAAPSGNRCGQVDQSIQLLELTRSHDGTETVVIFPGSFHHIGMACRSIEKETADIVAIGYHLEGPPVADPIQKVRVQFFGGQGPRV